MLAICDLCLEWAVFDRAAAWTWPGPGQSPSSARTLTKGPEPPTELPTDAPIHAQRGAPDGALYRRSDIRRCHSSANSRSGTSHGVGGTTFTAWRLAPQRARGQNLSRAYLRDNYLRKSRLLSLDILPSYRGTHERVQSYCILRQDDLPYRRNEVGTRQL